MHPALTVRLRPSSVSRQLVNEHRSPLIRRPPRALANRWREDSAHGRPKVWVTHETAEVRVYYLKKPPLLRTWHEMPRL